MNPLRKGVHLLLCVQMVNTQGCRKTLYILDLNRMFRSRSRRRMNPLILRHRSMAPCVCFRTHLKSYHSTRIFVLVAYVLLRSLGFFMGGTPESHKWWGSLHIPPHTFSPPLEITPRGTLATRCTRGNLSYKYQNTIIMGGIIPVSIN
jgi:hypothetical protein